MVCCWRKTIAMNSVCELEKLVSNGTLTADSETSSMYEAETTFVTPKILSCDQTVVTVENKTGNQNVCDDKRPNCLENRKCFSKEKQPDDPLQDQKEPNEGLILEEKDPSDEQVRSSSEESDETIVLGQDNIHDRHEFLFTDVNIENMEESLQTSLIEQFSKTQGKISPMVSNNNKIERLVTSKKDL